MKRFLIIAGFFLLCFVLMLTGCTCKCMSDETRGLGYECIACSVDMCDAVLCTRKGVESMTEAYLAIEGTDYGKPIITFEHNQGNTAEFSLQMEVYSSFTLNMEICFVQNGVLLETVEHEGELSPGQTFTIQRTLYLEGYDPEGGDVYYFINRFEACIKVRNI